MLYQGAAITQETALTSVLISVAPGSVDAGAALLRNGNSRVGVFFSIITEDSLVSWDLADEGFLEVNRRIDESLIEVWYDVAGHGEVLASEIPSHLESIIAERDPFRRVLASSQQVLTGVGPRTEFWFKRGATAPALPSLATFDYDADVTVASLMEAAGWELGTPTGTDTLYWTRVTWSVVAGVSSASASPVASDDIRYSTDDGASFSATPPADMADVDAIEVYQEGYGWIEYPLREDVISPFVNISGEVWQNAENGNDAADQFINLASETDLLDDNYAVGFTVRQAFSWSDLGRRLQGHADLPIEGLQLARPQDIAGQTADGQVGRATYIVVQNKEHGAVSVGLCDPATLLSDYDQQYWGTFRVVFVSYPRTALTEAAADSATVVYLEHKDGLATGDTLFIGDEQMTLGVLAASADSSHGGGFSATVTRGANGTTAAAHADAAEVRGIVNKDAVRHLCITRRHGVPDHTRFRVTRLRKRGAD